MKNQYFLAILLCVHGYLCFSNHRTEDTNLRFVPKSSSVDENTGNFPLVLHHIYGLWDDDPPDPDCTDHVTRCMHMKPKYATNLHACANHSRDLTLYLWDAAMLEQFISTHEPWFLDTWKSYPYPVQRADSARYILLYHFGGIYLDIDIKCLVDITKLFHAINKDKTKKFSFRPTAPFGLTNSYMVAKQRDPLMRYVVDGLYGAAGWPLFMPYTAVMCSTGPLYLTVRVYRYLFYHPEMNQHVHLINTTEYRRTYFHHVAGNGWHAYDAQYIKIYGRHQSAVHFCLVSILVLCVYFAMKLRKSKILYKIAVGIIVVLALFALWLLFQATVCVTR